MKQNIYNELFPRRAQTETKLSELVWDQLSWNEIVFPTTLLMESSASVGSLFFRRPLFLFVPSQQLLQSHSCWLDWSSHNPSQARAASQIQRSTFFPVLLSSGILCQYWESATERDWHFNYQRMLMMPFSISAPLPQPQPTPSQGGACLYLEPQWGKRIKIKSNAQVIPYEIKLENSHIVSSHIV